MTRREHRGKLEALHFREGRKSHTGTYFVFVKEKDTKNDKASDLDREGAYRVNMGISKDTYLSMFKELPARPPKGEIIKTGHNFIELDKIMSHPLYGWAAWICV